jgi:hypothetical protein
MAFDNLGSAGGHKSAARAEIPLSNIKDHVKKENGNMLLKWIMGHIEKKRRKKTASL